MDGILRQIGFKPTDNENEYVKNLWTVRLDGDLVEMFDDPDEGEGLYYYGKLTKEMIVDVLEKIFTDEIKINIPRI